MEKGNYINLSDNNGNVVEYEILDIIEYNENIYAVLCEKDDTEVLIVRVEETENFDESEYIVEQDEKTINEVYKMFKEKYGDDIIFKD